MANWKLPSDRKSFALVTVVTLLRVPVSLAFAGVVVGLDPSNWFVIAGLLLMLTVMEVSDGLDGYLARSRGVQTEWGAMLDPYSDSVSRLIVYFSLAVAGLIHPVVPLIMAFRDVTVAYCRILMTRSGQSVAAKTSGKIKAVVQGVGAYVAVLGGLYLPLTGSWPIWVNSVLVGGVTLWSIGQYAQGALQSVRGGGTAS